MPFNGGVVTVGGGFTSMRILVGHDELHTTVFEQAVGAPPFEPDAASELGIVIADGRDGSFRLEVDSIDVCRRP